MSNFINKIVSSLQKYINIYFTQFHNKYVTIYNIIFLNLQIYIILS